jgi:hypothetical protein
VEQLLRQGNLYMIAQRREARFVWDTDAVINPVHSRIPFEFEIPGVVKGCGTLSIEKDLLRDEGVDYEFGDMLVRAAKPTDDDTLGEVF